MNDQITTPMRIVPQSAADPSVAIKNVSLFNPDGTPITVLTASETGADVLLTGYTGPDDASPVASTDSVNEAVAKLEGQVAEVDVTGAILTGLVAGEVEPVAATDTVLEAIAKLQAQINNLT